MNMRIVEAQGYSKEKAYATTDLTTDLDKLRNATQSWKKAGSPVSDKKLNEFFTAYNKEKKAVGSYVVQETASDDTRLRPYSVVNEATKGKRKYTTVYQIKPAVFKVKTSTVKEMQLNEEGIEVEVDVEVVDVKVVSTGAVEGRAAKKDEAIKLAKELVKENKIDYTIELVKEVTEGQKFASYLLYSPSKSAELGKFLFAVD